MTKIGWLGYIGDYTTRFFQVTLLGVLSDLFRGENVTSIWVIKRSLGRSWYPVIYNIGIIKIPINQTVYWNATKKGFDHCSGVPRKYGCMWGCISKC